MPIFKKEQKKFYSTRDEVLKIFCHEEKLKCYCSTEIWAGNENKRTCYNCARKWNLADELKKKDFWKGNKDLKYWKICRQGRYKELKIAPVYPKSQFVGYINMSEEKINKLLDDMNLSSEEESDHGWDD